MSQTDRITCSLDALFHPVSHYDSPDDVLRDGELSIDEKRMILSSWASDMYAIESKPALRRLPGVDRELPLSDILSALQRLDRQDRRVYAAAKAPNISMRGNSERRTPPQLPIALNQARWSREANVRRYRKLLDTQLSDHERRFVEQRLAEELQD